MLGTGCVSAGGIYSRDGGEPWAQSDGFNVDAKDVIVLVSAIGSGNFEPVYNGVQH